MALDKVWISIGSLLRFTFSTYETRQYDKIPQVDIFPAFANIKTFDDIVKNENILNKYFAYSPTSCYFDLSNKVNNDDIQMFYRDHQDCVIWYVDNKTGNVIANKKYIVSASMPEFLTRIYLENMMWYHIYHGNDITDAGSKYFIELKKLNS